MAGGPVVGAPTMLIIYLENPHIYNSYEFWKKLPDFLQAMKCKKKKIGINFSVDSGFGLKLFYD